MIDIEALVFALRCSATPGGECGKKEKCPYFLRETEEEIAKFRKKYDPCGQYPIDFFDSCDIDRIAIDAADTLEGFLL